VRRGERTVAVVVPPGYGDRLAAGADVQIEVIGDPTTSDERAAASAVSEVVGAQAGRIEAARFAVARSGVSFTAGLDAAAAATVRPMTVETTSVDSRRQTLPEGFSYSAPTMLVLFVFINALAGGAGIIESRRLGMYARMTAAPVTPAAIVAGETVCALALAVLQSILIVAVGTVFFGVGWGDPLAAAALIGVWALVGAGAGVLSGTLFRTPEQAGAIGPSLGIAFGMLGGCMWPLEIVPTAMRTLGHAFPHAWAVDAWTAVLSRHAGVGQIGRQLLVLGAFAAGLLVIASVRLRRGVTA